MAEVAHSGEPIIQRQRPAWRLWFTLGIIVLQFAVPFLLAVLPAFHPLHTATAALMQVDPGSRDGWVTELLSDLEEWRLQCAQESKQASSLLVSLPDLYALVQRQQQQFRSAAVQTSIPIVFSLPRRLSPSSTDDDPVLS